MTTTDPKAPTTEPTIAIHPSAGGGSPDGGPGYAAAGEHRRRLTALCGNVGAVGAKLAEADAQRRIGTLQERLASESFRVMVVGDFKRGKSTFVNALLGDRVLPVKATPTTAVITEVTYAEKPSARLFRRDGGEAEDIDPAELIHRITIDNSAPEDINPYVRAEVAWPLELCRNGVVLVDSPGLNEHAAREEVTLKYLAQADAVVFMQHAIAPMSIGESQFLRGYLDAHEPFFVFTYLDAVDPDERDDVMSVARKRITDVRPDREDRQFFFVDGRLAMQSRQAGDRDGYARSGVAELARAIEQYLVRERHKVKILAPARGLRGVARDLAEVIPHKRSLLDLHAADLQGRWEAAQGPLGDLHQEADRINDDLGNEQVAMQQRVESMLGTFLTSVAADAPDIAATAAPEAKISLVPWHVKEKAEQVTKEIAAASAAEIESRIAIWATETLEPAVRSDLETMSRRTNANLESFDSNLSQLRLKLSGVEEAAAAGEGQEEPPLTRILASMGGWVLGGVAGGLMGARFGPKEILRTMLPTIMIYLAWLVTPFGLPTLLAALVIQGLFQGIKGTDRLSVKMRETIGKELAKQLRIEAPGLAHEAAAGFAAECIQPVREAVAASMAARLAQITTDVEAAEEAHRQGDAEVAARRAELDGATRLLRGAQNELDDLIDDVAAL